MADSTFHILLGAALSIASGAFAHGFSERSKARNFTAAIMAEIESICGMIERRKYKPLFQSFLADLKAHQRALVIYGSVDQPYFDVYLKNLDHLGYLGARAAPVVSFYHLAFGLVEDLRTTDRLSQPFASAQIAQLPASIRMQEEQFNNLIAMFTSVSASGANILTEYRTG